jgi:GNAT superfamily N-acetyltransferase
MTAGIPAVLAERSEAEALHDFETGAPARARAALGMETLRVGGGVALSMRGDPTQFWSKGLGFGFDEPITAGLMGRICDFYRSQRPPVATLQLAPSVLPADWDEICAKEKITAGSAWVKLVSDVETALARIEEHAPLAPSLRVGPVTTADASEWASVMMRVFNMPGQHLAEMTAESAGRPGWHPYAVWQGEEIVATATMHVHEDAAQFFGGATLPSARRRGAQTALLAARAKAAHAAGCRWLVAETGAPQPGEHNSSLHNMLRTGFNVLYERRNWIWRPGTTGR